jgi:hypothetical protein
MKTFVIRKQRATKEMRIGLPPTSGSCTIPRNNGFRIDNRELYNLHVKKHKKYQGKNGEMPKY